MTFAPWVYLGKGLRTDVIFVSGCQATETFVLCCFLSADVYTLEITGDTDQ